MDTRRWGDFQTSVAVGDMASRKKQTVHCSKLYLPEQIPVAFIINFVMRGYSFKEGN